MFKIMHIADSHFHEKRLDECIRNFEFICEYAEKEKPDLIVHAGDLFHKNTVINSPEYLGAVELMQRLAMVAKVFIIRGNHDPKNSLDIFEELVTHNPIRVFSEIETDLREVNDQLLNILFLPYVNVQEYAKGSTIADMHQDGNNKMRAHIQKFTSDPYKDRLNLIIAHMSVKGAELANSEMIQEGEIMINVEDIDQTTLDGVLLGHIHKNDQDLFVGTKIRYAGSHYRTRFDEMGTPGFQMWTFYNGQTNIEFIPTPARNMVQMDLDEDETKNYLSKGKLPFSIPEETDMKITFTVPEGFGKMVDKASIIESGPDSTNITVSTRVKPKTVIRSDKIADIKTVPELMKEWGRVMDVEITARMVQKVDLIDQKVRLG